MRRTINFYCNQVEEAYERFLRDPRTICFLLDACEELKSFRAAHRAKESEDNQLKIF